MSEDKLKIDFGGSDGMGALEAVDRTMRAITMSLDGAIGELLKLGWTRRTVNLEMDPANPLPCYVTLKMKRVFRVWAETLDDGRISIRGEWLQEPKGPSFLEKMFAT